MLLFERAGVDTVFGFPGALFSTSTTPIQTPRFHSPYLTVRAGSLHAADAMPVHREGGVVFATSGREHNLVTVWPSPIWTRCLCGHNRNVSTELLGRISFRGRFSGINYAITKHNTLSKMLIF